MEREGFARCRRTFLLFVSYGARYDFCQFMMESQGDKIAGCLYCKRAGLELLQETY